MTRTLALLTLAAVLALSACGRRGGGHYGADDLECMTRAMYFESHRSSRDGLVAVGSVVMNRVASPDFPDTVCGVVGQPRQFAPGILTAPMVHSGLEQAQAAARAVLAGERHPQIGNALFFHVASYRPGYDNIHYVLTAGGNAFYERRRPELVTSPRPPAPREGQTPA